MADVVIVREGRTDRWGDPIPGSAERIRVRGVTQYPKRSDERDDNTVITGMVAILPPRSPIPMPQDEVILWPQFDEQGEYVEGSGERFQVHGQVGQWDFLDGDPAGIEVQLEQAR